MEDHQQQSRPYTNHSSTHSTCMPGTHIHTARQESIHPCIHLSRLTEPELSIFAMSNSACVSHFLTSSTLTTHTTSTQIVFTPTMHATSQYFCTVHTESNPNRNPRLLPSSTQSIVSIQLNLVTCRAYPNKFIRNSVVAPFIILSVVISVFPNFYFTQNTHGIQLYLTQCTLCIKILDCT